MALHTEFERQAALRPDAVAVVCDDEVLTYRALNARANRLAHRLRRSGVGTDDLVGLYLERSVELVVGLVGILKAGAAYVPLDPDNPSARTRFVLDDARPRTVVTHSALRPRLATSGCELVCMDDPAPCPAADEDDPPPVAGADHLAYVIYTSGSTGQPKGTLVTHGNVERLFAVTEGWFRFGPHDVWTVFHSFAFDFSVWELWGALRYGGRAVVVPAAVARAPAAFHAMLRAHDVTVLCQTPSAFYALQDADRTAPARPDALRLVIFGGEALDFHRLAPWFERHGDATQLVNMYGITETTVHATYHPVARDHLGEGSLIGVPLPDLRIHLLDERLAPVPPGADGEICVGGPGVTRGYLHRPDLTAERFIRDPFSADPAARLYRSGDRARLRSDGCLEFRGRVDDQVKLRGYRIEPREIEAALDRCPGIRRSAVVLRDKTSHAPELVAYVVAEDAATLARDALRSALSAQLPPYMVPAAFVAMPALPLTVNGKLDRSALPAPRREDRVEAAAERPRTPTEARVATLWAETLGVDRVGIFDDYFALGAHSLMVAQVTAALADAFAIPLPVGEVLAARNIAALARVVDGLRETAPEDTAEPLAPRRGDGPAPTAFPQDMALYFHELAPGNLAYNNQATIRLRGTLDVACLERALAEIVRRHEALRTTFARGEHGWTQQVHPPWPVRLDIVDAAPGDTAGRCQHRFDPQALPLVRWTLLRHAHDDHTLLHVEHHLIHDGWSFGVFVRELVALYSAAVAGRPSPLPELQLQFADYARWQRARDAAGGLDPSRAYWRRRLAGAPAVLDLPTDHPRPARQTFRGDEVQVDVTPALARALRGLARAHQCSLFSVMLAGFVAVLHRYSGQQDIVVGAGYANRERRELAPLIGMIVNMLPLRIDLAGDPGFAELAARVQSVAREAMAHQELPFDAIVRTLGLPHDPSRNPLCQVAFSFHDSPLPAVRMPGLAGEVAYPHNGSAKFDMNVIVVPHAEQQADAPVAARDEHITIKWDCNTDVFAIGTVERMLDALLTILAAAAADPQRTLGDLTMASPADRARFARWNATARSYPRERTVHALFSEQAAATPGRTALIQGDRRLTYGELDRRSDALARHLRQCGVHAGDCVGLCVERSFALVTGLLAILKAGGAYVPLDPDYPAGRLDFMLRDTGAAVLVTTAPHREAFRGFGGRLVCLDDAEPEGVGPQEDVPFPALDGRALAYVMYTSGSTGLPKGVGIEHRSILRLVRNTDFAALDAGQRFLQLAPVSFDAATFEIWGSLLNGAELVLQPPGTPSLGELARTLRTQRITTLWLTASLFHQMVDFELDALRHVPQILAGGEALSVDHVRRMIAALPPGHRLINGYGPTENTTFTCCHTMTRESTIGRTVPIGRPIANTTVQVLDAGQRPVSLGVPGELCIGGDGLARGYLNQPQMTAERFVEVDGCRLYRSGDRVRWRPDGTLEFLGRDDDQVKLRGFRIELGEIEAALVRHAAVRECVVTLHAPAGVPARLVAHVVAATGAAVDAKALREHLATQLPAYMVPAEFVAIPALPLTPVGKVDRAALAGAIATTAQVRPEQVPPRTDTERALAGIWARHLGRDDVGVDDDFFDAGGHSLAAAGMFAAIAERFGLELPLSLLFEAPTIAGIARAIDERTRASSNVLIPVRREGRKPPMFAMLGVGGNFAAYAALSRAFGDDQPLYSLEMPGLAGDTLPDTRIEDIVPRLQEQMSAVPGAERCVLLGACAGALVVYELARALAADGCDVRHVIMLDPPPTGGQRARRLSSLDLWRQLSLPRFVASRVWLGARRLGELKGSERSAFLRQKAATLRDIVERRDLLRESRQELQFTRVREATSSALSAFAPKPYDGRVTLVVGDRYSLDGEDDASATWRALCRGAFDVARVPGKDTGAMLQPPNLAQVTAQIGALLGQA